MRKRMPNMLLGVAFRLFALLHLILCATVVVSPAAARQLTPLEEQGKQIYFSGVSPSGQPIHAYVGVAQVEVPGDVATCASCHGSDGLGRPEGGVIPIDTTWKYLTKPYGHTHQNGRKHPPFTEETLKRSLLYGADPAGHIYDVSMPRYNMSEEDLDALVAYLKVLGSDLDPGLSDTTIRVGTILPTQGPLQTLGQDVGAILTAYFAEVNAQGGIYNRRLELRVMPVAESPAATRERTARFLEEEPVFVMVGAFLAGAEKELVGLVEDAEIPLVGPLSLLPQGDPSLQRHSFYVLSGLGEQASVLLDFTANRLPKPLPRLAIMHPGSAPMLEIAEGLKTRSQPEGWSGVATLAYTSGRFDATGLVQAGRQQGADVVLFLGGDGPARALMAEALRQNWTPSLLLPGALVGKAIFTIPAQFESRIWLALPTLPSDRTRAGMQEYSALMAKYNLPARHRSAQVSAYCAAKILVEGLKRSGKVLSREKLMTALEGLYEFETGLTPPITYGPNRRIGALGAYVVALNLAEQRFVPVGPWIKPE